MQDVLEKVCGLVIGPVKCITIGRRHCHLTVTDRRTMKRFVIAGNRNMHRCLKCSHACLPRTSEHSPHPPLTTFLFILVHYYLQLVLLQFPSNLFNPFFSFLPSFIHSFFLSSSAHPTQLSFLNLLSCDQQKCNFHVVEIQGKNSAQSA